MNRKNVSRRLRHQGTSCPFCKAEEVEKDLPISCFCAPTLRDNRGWGLLKSDSARLRRAIQKKFSPKDLALLLESVEKALKG